MVVRHAPVYLRGVSRLKIPASISHPVRLLPLTFLTLIIVGTMGLMLPFASSNPGTARFMPALFTSTSAVTVTGLSTVDTATHWTPAGQAMILVLVEIGGLGIVALATLPLRYRSSRTAS